MTITSGNVYQKSASFLHRDSGFVPQRSRGTVQVVPPADTWDGNRLPIGVGVGRQVRTLNTRVEHASVSSIALNQGGAIGSDAASCSNWKSVSNATDPDISHVGGFKNYLFGLLFGSIIGIGFYFGGQAAIDDSMNENSYPAVVYADNDVVSH